MLLPLIYLIRHGLNEEVDLSGDILIIDSFPVPVCQPIRNRRAKIFRGYADIGYKATKKIYYYGFKVHAIVSDDGYLLDYIVTKASVHDAKETVELITNAHPDNRYLLGDEGYLGKNLHQRLEQMGYTLWTPYRKNMKNAQKHNKHYLMALRRTIESDFSLLSYYNAENNRARSLAGFQERLEVAILAYNMAYCLERFNQHHAYSHYQNNPFGFEYLAKDVTRLLIEDSGTICHDGWVTKASGDGGYDYVLRIDIGNHGLSQVRQVVLGQAKCYERNNGVSGKDVDRIIARLKRGWLAAFVTTSYFTNATQQEILEDNYPILLITGKQVAEIVNKELYRKNISLDKYLKSLNMEQEYKNPEDILKEE